MPVRLAKETQTAQPGAVPRRTVYGMAEALQKHVKSLLREMVPNGEANGSQQIARMVLADLLQAMWARNPRGDTPTTVRGCIDIAEVTAQADDPTFRFAYEDRLADARWLEREPSRA
jgi:hypothetical protein